MALKRLNVRHYKAIKVMAEGGTTAEAARQTGIPLDTMYHYRADPLFRAALDSTIEKVRVEGLDALKASTRSAVSYLLRAVAPDRPIDSPGVKAAAELLDRAGLVNQVESAVPTMNTDDGGQVLALLRSLPPALLLEALGAGKPSRPRDPDAK